MLYAKRFPKLFRLLSEVMSWTGDDVLSSKAKPSEDSSSIWKIIFYLLHCYFQKLCKYDHKMEGQEWWVSGKKILLGVQLFWQSFFRSNSSYNIYFIGDWWMASLRTAFLETTKPHLNPFCSILAYVQPTVPIVCKTEDLENLQDVSQPMPAEQSPKLNLFKPFNFLNLRFCQ